MTVNDIISSAIVTGAFFVALISSVVNVVISIINYHHINRMEQQKTLNEIDKYRYTKLYELVLNWRNGKNDKHPNNGSKVTDSALVALIKIFLEDNGRYDIAKPLLDYKYVETLDKIKEKVDDGYKLFVKKMKDNEAIGISTISYDGDVEAYFDIAMVFSEELKNAINKQLEELLQKTI